MSDLRTSSIELISSTHGRQRRLERDISKKDLQAAIKYGLVEPQYHAVVGLRHKVTYNNIIYITDATMTKEVTSFSAIQLPLEKYPIDTFLSQQINEQRRRLSTGITAITSHTVIIVDQSASMNNGDVMGHRTRSRSAYYQIANEMIAGPLLKEHLSYTDVVTVIEMREDAVVSQSIYMEPCTWELHNKLVDLANEPLRGKGHGNYYPALCEALKVLSSTDNSTCALLLMFLSDGRPSDAHTLFKYSFKELYRRQAHTRETILSTVEIMCRKFKERLTFGTFGFAFDNGDLFELMKSMAERAKKAGASAGFSSGIDTNSLRTSLRTMSQSLMSTRANLSSIGVGSHPKQTVRPEQMKIVSDGTDTKFNSTDYNYHMEDPNKGGLVRYGYFIDRYNDELIFTSVPLQHPLAKGVAINKTFFDNGAERIVLECTEVTEELVPIGQPLVAKLCLSKSDKDQLPFHQICGRTQVEARRLARNFNKRLDFYNLKIPRIEFLEVSFYTMWSRVEPNKAPVCTSSYLVEKRLDSARYRKYNNNQGGVTNVNKQMIPIDTNANVGVRYQEDKEESIQNISQVEVNRIIDDDIPQAFSHWSYNYTKGELLVCDLQGELRQDFCLTDPAISSSRQRMYGDTDLGKVGQKRFFETHQCNPLCRILHLKMPTFY